MAATATAKPTADAPRRTPRTPATGQGPCAGRRAARPADPGTAGAAAQGRAADDEGAAPRARGQARVAGQAASRTSCARACASSASRIRRSWSCSGRPATSPTARSSRRSTSCGGPTCCRTSSCSLAIGRRPYDDESFRAEIRKSLEKYSRVLPLDDDAWRSFAERIAYQQLDFDDPARLRRRWRRTSTTIDKEHGTRGNHLFYLATQPSQFAEIVGPARAGRARPRAPRRRLAAGRHREAVRPRPRLGEAAQPRGRQGLPRVAGLPHRPLPRQGDGPEPAGLPVRQRHLRAALEPALRRPRADHRGRVDRHREPRRVLRADRRLARRPPEPPPPAGQPGRDGAAGDVRGERAARREGQGPARDLEIDPRRRPRHDVVRGQYGPGWVARDAGPGLSRGAGGRPGVGDRDVRRRPARRSTTGAGPASRSTSGPASGCPKRATEIAIQYREVPHRLFKDEGVEPDAEPARDPDPAGRGDHAALRGQGARASGSTSGR